MKFFSVMVLAALIVGGGLFAWRKYNVAKYATVDVMVQLGEMNAEIENKDEVINEIREKLISPEILGYVVESEKLAEHYISTGMLEADGEEQKKAYELAKFRLNLGVDGRDNKSIIVVFRDKSEEKATQILEKVIARHNELRKQFEAQQKQGEMMGNAKSAQQVQVKIEEDDGSFIVSAEIYSSSVEMTEEALQGSGLTNFIKDDRALGIIVKQLKLAEELGVSEAEAIEYVKTRASITLSENKKAAVVTYLDDTAERASKVTVLITAQLRAIVANALQQEQKAKEVDGQ